MLLLSKCDMKTWRTKKLRQLAEILRRIDSQKDMMNFLRDVMTLDELEEISSRWQAAQLIEKKEPYRDIAKHVGLSTATVSRVAYWLKSGEGGYRAALKKLKKK